MGGRIWLFIKRFGITELTSPFIFDNVIKIQSFDSDFFYINDHKIDHPILTNKHCQ